MSQTQSELGEEATVDTSWRPFALAWDDNVPLDLSFLYEREKPAGKHGFLGVRSGKLVFEDGVEACFNSGANFPSHAESEMVARRLAKFGVNMVRTHQMDAEWATPNIFQFNRVKPKDDTRSFDPESMDRLDYLVYCLKQEGIYLYLDMLTYRQFRPGDRVDSVDALGQAAKPYTYFDRRLIELQKEFNRDLWCHTNPYTKLAYREDPGIALCELMNEVDFFTQPPVLEPYRARLEERYRAWADERGFQVGPEQVDFREPDAKIARFFVQVMANYYGEMIAHLRNIGVNTPIAGTNWSRNLGVLAANLAGDFLDTHGYWNFPTWEHPDGCHTRPMVGSADNMLNAFSFERALDKPFFVSEWDHAWPDEWRAESPLFYAAIAAFQGWSGMTIHTYRYSTRGPVDSIGGGASTINGIPYRNHFDAFNDPAKFGLFYQAALIFRRGDVREAEKSVAVQVPAEREGWELLCPQEVPALSITTEQHKVGVALPGREARADAAVSFDRPSVDSAAGNVRSDTGELFRSWAERYGTVDTPMSKVVYGFVGDVEIISLEGLEIAAKTDFATIALSSLTEQPIEEADTLLLTAVGRCDNTDAQYDESRTHQLSYGHVPVLIEPIEATLRMRTSRPNLKVWVVSDEREAVTSVPSKYEDGVLEFQIGPQPWYNPSTIYYLIKV